MLLLSFPCRTATRSKENDGDGAHSAGINCSGWPHFTARHVPAQSECFWFEIYRQLHPTRIGWSHLLSRTVGNGFVCCEELGSQPGDVERSRTAAKDEVTQRVDIRNWLFILCTDAFGPRPFPAKGIAAAAAAAQAAAQVAEANAAAAAAVAAHAKVLAAEKEQQDPERKKGGDKDTERDDEAGKKFDLTESEEIIEEVGSRRPS